MRIADFEDSFSALEIGSEQVVNEYSIRADDQRINTVAREFFSEPKRAGGEIGGNAGYNEQQGFYFDVHVTIGWDV